MPCFFATPMHHYAMPRMCPRRSALCFAPCLTPLLTVSALLFLPSLLRLGFLVVFGLAQAATQLMFTFGFAMLVASTVRALLHEEEEEAGTRSASASCFAKMKAHAQHKTEAGANSKTEMGASKVRRHDLSSARLETTPEGIKVVVAAPGVAPTDLDVSVVEHSLRVKGETKRGVDVFCVDHQIVPPRHVDVNTAKCTHADGEVTIVLSKKIGKRIPIAAAAPAPADEQASTTEAVDQDGAIEAAVREVTGEGSEGEWEPLA